MTGFQAFFAGMFISSFSVGSLIGNLITIYRVLSIRRNGVLTQGLVKELIYDDEERLACRICVHYSTDSGRTLKIESATGSAFWRKLKGKHVDVIYKESDPTDAYIKKDFKYTAFFFLIFHLIVVSVGLFLIGTGIYIWIYY